MKLKGSVALPGDKSLSHRALMLASLSRERSVIENLSSGQDIISTRDCLENCGMEYRQDSQWLNIRGGHLKSPFVPLFCGNSGTTARMLPGFIAGQKIFATLTGDPSLSSRPMNRVVEPLREMGADISSLQGKLPVSIHPAALHGIEYTMPVASAQVKSALLFAGIHASGKTTVHQPILSRDHTEILMSALGYAITLSGSTVTVSQSDTPPAGFHFRVPADPSSAAFFAAGAAMVHESDVIFKHLAVNPTRFGFFSCLEQMGVRVEILDRWSELREPVADIRIRPDHLHAVHILPETVPALIDELPLVAILATQAEGTTIVEGAGELRVKESDRLHAITTNLEKMGARITEFQEGFRITGPTPLKGIHVETYHDHRIAMAFKIAGLISDGRTTLDDSECAAISFPEFQNVLNYLIQN